MDWITNKVAIGNYLEAQNKSLLEQEKIKAIISLDGSLSSADKHKLGVREILTHCLVDGHNDFRKFSRAVFAAIDLAERYPKILVHCHAGRSRSVAVVAGYLMKNEDLSVEEAIEKIKAIRETELAIELHDLLHLLN